MVVAYVMVKAYTGDADRLKADIEGIAGVDAAHVVAGDVDIITKVTVDAPVDVKDIAQQIRDLDGVENTQTYVAMH